jgi:hypothetical protein
MKSSVSKVSWSDRNERATRWRKGERELVASLPLFWHCNGRELDHIASLSISRERRLVDGGGQSWDEPHTEDPPGAAGQSGHT